MSDIARPYPPPGPPGGFAADNRAEGSRQYPPGQEKAHGGNANLAHAGNVGLAR